MFVAWAPALGSFDSVALGSLVKSIRDGLFDLKGLVLDPCATNGMLHHMPEVLLPERANNWNQNIDAWLMATF